MRVKNEEILNSIKDIVLETLENKKKVTTVTLFKIKGNIERKLIVMFCGLTNYYRILEWFLKNYFSKHLWFITLN